MQAPDPHQASRRNFGLDLLRCLAIAMVLANHAFLGFFVELGNVAWQGNARAASLVAFLSIEWLFVLSGFLIGTMMIRSFDAPGTFAHRARSFWLRRWFRTVPNYVLFLFVNIAIVAWGLHGTLHIGRPTWQHAVFSQNLLIPEKVPFFFNESWSLALDEWFYLLLPLLLGVALVAGARVRTAFLWATAILIVLPTAARFLVPIPADPLEWDHGIRRITLLHLDATGWGVLGAITGRWIPQFWERNIRIKAAVGLALMLLGVASVQAMFGVLPGPLASPLIAWPRFPVALALTCTGLGTFLALPGIARVRAAGPRVRRLVERFSNYTYSIYLSHFPILYLMAEVIGYRTAGPVGAGTLWGVSILWLALTVAVSAGVHHVFEKPSSDLRERFTRRIDASPFGPATPP